MQRSRDALLLNVAQFGIVDGDKFHILPAQ